MEFPFITNFMLTRAECPPRPDLFIMDKDSIQHALAYAAQHQLHLAERLGFGIHGTVFVAEGNTKAGKSAIKAHHSVEPFLRESNIYERLREARVTEIIGFHVPQWIGSDDELRVIEMTIVTRPFVLDFVGAYLDALREFSQEIWQEWQVEK